MTKKGKQPAKFEEFVSSRIRYKKLTWGDKGIGAFILDYTGFMFLKCLFSNHTVDTQTSRTYPVVLSWCLTSSKKSSTSLISLCLFQFFFLFLLKRFLRLLARAEGSAFDFILIKPGCDATTRFSLLADAMLQAWERIASSSFVVSRRIGRHLQDGNETATNAELHLNNSKLFCFVFSDCTFF